VNCLVLSNETTFFTGLPDDVADPAEAALAVTWMHGAPGKTLVLSRIEHELIRAFSEIEVVNALYAERDDEDVLMVFVVVPEHDDAVYQRVIDAEHEVRARVHDDFELRLRAHQGRNPIRAVPIRSLPLFLR
jgi:hypothetical protein